MISVCLLKILVYAAVTFSDFQCKIDLLIHAYLSAYIPLTIPKTFVHNGPKMKVYVEISKAAVNSWPRFETSIVF